MPAPYRISIRRNFFRLVEDADTTIILEQPYPAYKTKYLQNPGAETVEFVGDEAREILFPNRTGTLPGAQNSVNTPFALADLRDSTGAVFASFDALLGYLDQELGNFDLAASTGPGTPISQTEIAQFTDSVYIPTNTFTLTAGSNTPIPNDGVIQANPKGITGKALTYQTNTQLFELTSGQQLSGTLQITLIAPSPNTTVRLFLQVGPERAWDHTVYLRQAGAIVTQSIPFDFVASTAWDSASGQLIGFSLRAVELYNITISTNTNQ